jgi:hypothetical protein
MKPRMMTMMLMLMLMLMLLMMMMSCGDNRADGDIVRRLSPP